MEKWFKAACMAGLMAMTPLALAEETEAVVADEVAAEAPATGVEVSATGDQVVKVNTGNELIDAAANLAAKCAERSAAFKACDSMGGFKAMGCRKLAEMRYKDLVCSL